VDEVGAGQAVDGDAAARGDPGDDTIAVIDHGSTVVVQGLAATVWIAHADPTLDHPTVNGLDGNDTITATPAAQALILPNLLPATATTSA
jgi:hypothetical protein